MPEPFGGVLPEIAAPARDALRLCAEGNLPANVALMRLLMFSPDPDQAHAAISSVAYWLEQNADPAARHRVAHLRELWRATPNAWEVVNGVVGCMAEAEPGDREGAAQAEPSRQAVARWAQAFDRAAAFAGDPAAALYALGRPDLHAQTTREVIASLEQWNVLRAAQSILEIGCGSGRILERLATRATLAIGIDVSLEMLRLARSRCRSFANVALLATNGRDLAAFRAASFDVVLAVDAFPYVVSAGDGLAKAMGAEVARVLRPLGSFGIMNYSYRGDEEADLRDVAAMASQNGFDIVRAGTRDFAFWDATTFILQLRR
jgi:SAM-dependent methyltransferase